jgi:polyisoprenoid-binding protein YceI
MRAAKFVSGSILLGMTFTVGFGNPSRGARPPVGVVSADTGHVRYVVAEGSEARYRVREQLARISFPSDAVGTTQAVTGWIVFGADGRVVSDSSRFVIDLTTLETDSERRDRYVQRRTLETEQYPEAVLVPTAFVGLPTPLPESGEVAFRMIADLTVHGVTRPTTWDVTATFRTGAVTGTASTRFTFPDFNIQVPSVRSVLSVEDRITLEFGFRLVEASGSP